MFIEIINMRDIEIIETMVVPICVCCARPWCDYHNTHFEDCICSRPSKMNSTNHRIDTLYFTEILTIPFPPDTYLKSHIAVKSKHLICLHCNQSIFFNNSNLYLHKKDIIRSFFDIHETCRRFRQVNFIS
jgi:hypothetical protein